MLQSLFAELTESLGTTWRNIRSLSLHRQWMIVVFVIGLVLTFVSYRFSIHRTYNSWDRIEYDWGILVPILAAITFYVKRQSLTEAAVWEQLVGVAIVLVFVGVRYYFFVLHMREAPMTYSFIFVLIGLMMMLGGIGMLKWTWPGLMLLCLAFPLWAGGERFAFGQLQELSTKSSVFALETIGIDVRRDGNKIALYKDGDNGKPIDLNVAEACAGFRSMFTLLSLTLFAAFVLPGELWIKITMVLSAIPIALASNIVRIIVQCFAYMISPATGQFFHEYVAGFVMFPIMIGLIYLEYVILKNLVREEKVTTATFQMRPPVLNPLGGPMKKN